MFCIVSISSSNSSCSSNVLNEHVQGARHKSSYIHNIITWLLYFFPGFDRFIPGFDRFIPGFDRFIPVSIPVTEILPHPKPPHDHHHHNPNAHSSIKCVLFLYFDITSYHFIWNSYFQLEKKYVSMLRTTIFLRKTVDTNPTLSPSHFNGITYICLIVEYVYFSFFACYIVTATKDVMTPAKWFVLLDILLCQPQTKLYCVPIKWYFSFVPCSDRA